jgi:signal peptidase I
LLPLFLCVFGCGTSMMLGYSAQVMFEYASVPDDSMAPLLKPNVRVVISNLSYWSDDPETDDVVTVERDGRRRIRRIVAVPGETVEVTDGRLIVDGQSREIGYEPHGSGPDQAELVLGDDEYYVLADNRSATDSRTWGAISRDDIIGQVVFTSGPDGGFDTIVVTPTPSGASTP